MLSDKHSTSGRGVRSRATAGRGGEGSGEEAIIEAPAADVGEVGPCVALVRAFPLADFAEAEEDVGDGRG